MKGKGILLAMLVLLLTGCADTRAEVPASTEASVIPETVVTEAPRETLPEVRVREDRAGEPVFDLSMEDFIDRFNALYRQDRGVDYLAPADQWQDAQDGRYIFSEDARIWSLPTITVSLSDSGQVRSLSVDFDEHSRTEELYGLYEELCFYTLGVFAPELAEESVVELYTTLNQLAYDNIFPYEQGFGTVSVPWVLYYREGVGVYPYFAMGERVHLCLIPVTPELLAQYEQEGARIHEIED